MKEEIFELMNIYKIIFSATSVLPWLDIYIERERERERERVKFKQNNLRLASMQMSLW